MALFTQYAIAAAKMAIKDAEWENATEDQKERTGVCLGSGIGSLDDMATTTLSFAESVRKPASLFSENALKRVSSFRKILWSLTRLYCSSRDTAR